MPAEVGTRCKWYGISRPLVLKLLRWKYQQVPTPAQCVILFCLWIKIPRFLGPGSIGFIQDWGERCHINIYIYINYIYKGSYGILWRHHKTPRWLSNLVGGDARSLPPEIMTRGWTGVFFLVPSSHSLLLSPLPTHDGCLSVWGNPYSHMCVYSLPPLLNKIYLVYVSTNNSSLCMTRAWKKYICIHPIPLLEKGSRTLTVSSQNPTRIKNVK